MTACFGAFFNPQRCKQQLTGNERVCGSCHQFEIAKDRICVVSNRLHTPFVPRKRRVQAGDTTVEVRVFVCEQTLQPDKIRASEDDVSSEDALIVVFQDKESASLALKTWPEALMSLEIAFPQSYDSVEVVRFGRCPHCLRKVYPVDIVSSCTKPSCASKARKGKRKSTLGQASAPPGQIEKRRRRWKIVPEMWQVDKSTSRKAVIISPEPLCPDTVEVTFGGVLLVRDVDYVCGVSEVIIPRVPFPKQNRDSAVRVEITDKNGVYGVVRFCYKIDWVKAMPYSVQSPDFLAVDDLRAQGSNSCGLLREQCAATEGETKNSVDFSNPRISRPLEESREDETHQGLTPGEIALDSSFNAFEFASFDDEASVMDKLQQLAFEVSSESHQEDERDII